MDIKNKRLTDDEFYEIRKTVLNQWPTGKDVDLEEAFAFHKSLPDSKIFRQKLLVRLWSNRGPALRWCKNILSF